MHAEATNDVGQHTAGWHAEEDAQGLRASTKLVCVWHRPVGNSLLIALLDHVFMIIEVHVP